ncbi:MAG: class I SAM-dependent methyltransferase [Solirubrobacterales bacterium]
MGSGSSGENESWEGLYAEHWAKLGPETREAILGLLPEDWSFEGRRVLDFGCGPGRTLQEFGPEARAGEIWGVDIDAGSIERVRRDLCPPMRAEVCGPAPPLGFEDASFDLAWAISVFTHLTDHSAAWLLELHRILKPGGYLIATYMGRFHSEILAHEPWDEDRIGMNVLCHDHGREQGAPMVLMSEWWVREHWGRAFEIVRIAPDIHRQSWAAMRRKDVELTPEELLRPGDDPREFDALRHNVRQVQRELEEAKAEAARREAEIREEFEGSLSWRATAPLRRLRRSRRD